MAIVRETEWLIYKDPSGQYDMTTPKYVGRFESNSQWTSGCDGPRLTNYGPLLADACKCRFSCAAMSDNLLVAGASLSNFFMVFSIAEEPRPGRCIFKRELTSMGLVVRKILFNAQGTEFVVLSSNSAEHEEVWQFFPTEPFLLKATARNNSTATIELTHHSK